MRRWLAAPIFAAGALAMAAGPVLGLLVWTLTVTPGTVESGTETTFTLTVLNLDLGTGIACVEVALPDSFEILGAAGGIASNGGEWEAVVFPNMVAAHSLRGGDRLKPGESVTFVVRAIARVEGAWTWQNHVHRQRDCSGVEEIGVPLAILVVPGDPPPPTPAPSPTPTPTPTPTPIVSPDPLPTVPLPSLGPVLPLPPVATIEIRPTPAPTARPSPVAFPTPDLSDTGSAGLPAPPQGGAGGGAGGPDAAVLELAGVEPEQSRRSAADVALGPLGVIDGVTVWAIPSAIIGGPGLLVILWVAFQTGVALAWIPAVRRMRGNDARPGAFSGPRRTAAP